MTNILYPFFNIFVMEEDFMDYKAVIKEIPAYTMYCKQDIIDDFGRISDFILDSAEECRGAHPNMKCVESDYCYVSYLDEEFKEKDILVEYAQAVTKAGIETDNIKFKTIESTKAVCVSHKGSYDGLSTAYEFVFKWVYEKGHVVSGPPRECYIYGCWNREKEADWLTEIQIPIRS